jgi:SAM-dependent methyltransferase
MNEILAVALVRGRRVRRFSGMVLAVCALVVVSGTALPTWNVAVEPQAEMFSESQAYERFMGRWSRALAPQLVRFAGVRDGDAVLDIGSGTGALALAIREAVPSTSITGIDPATTYVAYAQSLSPDSRVRFEVGDAQALRFAAGTFDRTLSLLVINFIPDPRTALHEMIRVTRPGGVVAAAVWDYADGMQMLRIFWDEAVAGDPTAERRDERHMRFCKKGELADLWREHGLLAVEDRALSVQLAFASFDDYWLPFLAGQGPAGAYTASLDSDARDALRERLRRRLLGGGGDRAFTLQGRAWAVTGVVPSR